MAQNLFHVLDNRTSRWLISLPGVGHASWTPYRDVALAISLPAYHGLVKSWPYIIQCTLILTFLPYTPKTRKLSPSTAPEVWQEVLRTLV